MSYDLTGRVKLVGDARVFGSGFEKRELVVTVEDGKYPQDICIEFCQGNVSKLDDVRAGDEVTVSFDLRGREYNGRYFNSLNGWKVVVEGRRPSSTERPPVTPTPGKPLQNEDEDDIPF